MKWVWCPHREEWFLQQKITGVDGKNSQGERLSKEAQLRRPSFLFHEEPGISFTQDEESTEL
jgi:hypothetical protein